MRAPLFALSAWLAVASCAGSGGGKVASAPSTSTASASLPSGSTGTTPAACGSPWRLGVIGGDARLVVVCSTDVRRQPLDESSPVGRGLAQALEPARERVCACARNGKPPEFVDLVFSARPEDQRVTVEAKGDEDLDPQLGPPFIACVATVSVPYSPQPSDACDGAGKVTSFMYPVRLELGP